MNEKEELMVKLELNDISFFSVEDCLETTKIVVRLLKQARLEGARELAGSVINTENPYPESVFVEPTKEQYEIFYKILADNNLTLDKFSGAFGRKVINNCKDKLKEYLSEMEQEGR